MALQMQKSFSNYGFSASSAYFKVGNLTVFDTSTGWSVKFEVKTYFSASAKTNGSAPIESQYYTMTYDTSSATQSEYNIVKCAYEHLKTLSEFSGATNV